MVDYVMKSLLVCLSLLLIPIGCLAGQVTDEVSEPNVKIGTLKGDEVWQGDVYLVGDVIVPKGVTLTIAAGTRLFYAEYDISNSGKDPHQTELVVQGEVIANSTEESPILVATIGESGWKRLNDGDKSVEIRFKPYQIDTEPMREEFHQFKIQYIVFWSLVYTMWILAL